MPIHVRFLVDKESTAYYDSTLLWAATRKLNDSNNQEASGSSSGLRAPPGSLPLPEINTNVHASRMQAQQFRSPYPNQPPTPFGNNIDGMSPMTGQGTPRGGPGFPGTPFNPMPPGQFYGGDALTPGGRIGIPDNMAPSPLAQRRITRGMAEEYPGLYGN